MEELKPGWQVKGVAVDYRFDTRILVLKSVVHFFVKLAI